MCTNVKRNVFMSVTKQVSLVSLFSTCSLWFRSFLTSHISYWFCCLLQYITLCSSLIKFYAGIFFCRSLFKAVADPGKRQLSSSTVEPVLQGHSILRSLVFKGHIFKQLQYHFWVRYTSIVRLPVFYRYVSTQFKVALQSRFHCTPAILR